MRNAENGEWRMESDGLILIDDVCNIHLIDKILFNIAAMCVMILFRGQIYQRFCCQCSVADGHVIK